MSKYPNLAKKAVTGNVSSDEYKANTILIKPAGCLEIRVSNRVRLRCVTAYQYNQLCPMRGPFSWLTKQFVIVECQGMLCRISRPWAMTDYPRCEIFISA